MHYRDLANIPLIKPQVPATPPVLNKYQLIPDDILNQYQVDFSLETNVIKEYEGFVNYNNNLAKAKKDRELYKKKLAEIKEQERIAEMKKKAPGLSNDILKPSSKTAAEELPAEQQKDKVDVSEFDPGLASPDPWENQDVHDLQALKEIMSKSAQSPQNDNTRNINIPQNTNITTDQRYSNTPPYGSNSPSPDHYQFGHPPGTNAPIPGSYISSTNSHQQHIPQFPSNTNNVNFQSNPSDLQHQMENMNISKSNYPRSQKLPSPTQVKFNYNSPPVPPPKPEFSPDTLRRASKFPSGKQREFMEYFQETKKHYDQDAVLKSYELFGTRGQLFLENFESLSEMGFLKDKIIQALVYSKNSKNDALEYLFNN
ncbi:hypothetical protein HDV01_007622 [Terramyces sp. JEL0728]|nr:hypothetical protein HDV01_007622 [Terramyces sp. JEL0728]